MNAIGLNTITNQRKFSVIRLLGSQFSSPFIVILLAAAAITGFFLHELADASIIIITVFLNTFLGFYQEFRAEKSLQALQKLLTPVAKVVRNGKRIEVPTSTLVPGDIVVLEIGRTVPADGELLEAHSMTVNEAMLTGESAPIPKSLKENHVFMGTTVVTGIGTMRVTEIGNNTKMGKIAASLSTIDEQETPLQHEVHRLALVLGVVVAGVALFIFLTGSFLGKSPIEMFTLGVAVSVSAIPEGLTVSLTAILAIGMQRILKHKALVRKLVSAEALGAVTVICADKTGTLTEGKMRVVEMDLVNQQEGKNAIAVCNDLRDPLEMAMFDAIPDASDRVKRFPRTSEIPFSPSYKYIATVHPIKSVMYVSGAPEVLLEKSTLSTEKMDGWKRKFKQYAQDGLRLVAVASKSIHPQKTTVSHRDITDLTWLGIVLFEDPVRSGVAASLQEAQRLGIKVKVVTGDYQETARAVLRKIGVPDIELFSRVSPEEKVHIVEKLQEQGEVVAMMGDGVNDAPALKAADISVVVSDASDVAKQLADVVLLDNNFRTITTAIVEGRGMFSTFKKVLAYLLSDSFAEVVLVMGAFLLPIPLPITAAMILWVNLIVDGLPSLALTVEPHIKTSMVRFPLLDSEIKLIIATVSLLKGLTTLILFVWIWQLTHDIILARSTSLLVMVIVSLFSVFSLRSLERPITKINLLSNYWLLTSIIAGFGLLLLLLTNPFLQGAFGMTMPGSFSWFAAFGAGTVTILAIEFVKWRSKMSRINE